ncbi:MAG: hypothetical protein U0K93_01960 [Acutalibacteraceae bacterium]|nr:hypothetical protein [Acutalibacteraceae bacterium]
MRNLFKKSLTLCLVAILAFSCFAGIVSAETAYTATIAVVDQTITQGTTSVDVTLNINSSQIGINEALIEVSSDIGTINSKATLDEATAAIASIELPEGSTNYGSFYLSAKNDISGETGETTVLGSIATASITVTFTVDKNKAVGTYPINIAVDGVRAASSDEDVIKFTYEEANISVVAPHVHEYKYTPNEGDTHTYDCSTCENFDPVTEACTLENGACIYCLDPQEEVEVIDIIYGTTRSLSVREPWAINYFVQPYDKTIYNETKERVKVSIDTFDDYGIYILFDIDVPENTEVDAEYVKTHGTKYAFSNDGASESDGRYTVRFEDRVFTYLMNKNVYTVNFTLQGSTEICSAMSTTTFATTIDDRLTAIDKNDTLTEALTAEKNMLNDMKALYAAVIDYRGDDNYSPVEARNIPKISDTTLPTIVENSLGYRFGLTRSLSVKEPWAINGFVKIYPADTTSYTIDLDTLNDYGTFVLKASDLPDSDVVPTVSDVISNPNTYVFSKTNGYNSIDGSGRYTFTLDDKIYTYQMNDALYIVQFYVTDDGLACGGLTTTSMYATMQDRLKVSGVPENEVNVINAMQALYESVDVYRNT